ncbi:MAG: SRPBCC family protein [Chloroflexi bacterium OHK40]
MLKTPITVHQLSSDHSELMLQVFVQGTRPAELFRALTEPEFLTRWWPTHAEVDAREGGRYCLSWPAMNWHLRGRFIMVIRPELLIYTWSWDHKPDLAERTVTIRLMYHDGGTLLSLWHGPYDRSDQDQADRQSHLEGWRHFLPKLCAII